MTTDNERWIRRWLADLYQRLDTTAKQRERAVAETLLATNVGHLCLLTVFCTAAMTLLPLLFGSYGQVGSIVLLYGAITVGLIVAVQQLRQIERTFRVRPAPVLRADRAFRALPPLDDEAVAYLTRVVNLTPLAVSDRGRRMLAQEIAEARAVPALTAWPAWDDVLALIAPPRPTDRK